MPELKLEHLSIEEYNPVECTAVVAIEPNIIKPFLLGARLLNSKYEELTVSEYITLEVIYSVDKESAPCGMVGDRIIENEWFYIESIEEVTLKLENPYVELSNGVILDTTQDGMDSLLLDADYLNELLLELLKNNEEILLKVECE